MGRIIFKSKLEQCFDTIREEFAKAEEQRDDALSKMEAWNKDTEIQRLTEEIAGLREEMSTGFHLTKEQWTEVRKWEEAHARRFHPCDPEPVKARKYDPGAAHFTYSFSYTHLGRLGTVECETCRRIAIEKSGGDYLKYLKTLTDRDFSCSIGEV